MKIHRIWAMPNKWTFTIPPIRDLIVDYIDENWIDPFAGDNSPADCTNDLNPDSKALFHIDALEFLKIQPSDHFDGAFFDPPYSITQAQQCYKSFGKDKLDITPSSMKYWKEIKDNLARVLKAQAVCICCGWSSHGLGKCRGFEMVEILLVPHGGSKNDTIVTVEVKK